MWTTRIALFLGLLGVLTLLTNIAAVLGPVYSFVGAAIIGSGIIAYLVQRTMYRKRAPKSVAFEVFTEFGPMGTIPREERLTKLFPRIERDEIVRWISDFEEVESELWRLAEQHDNNTPTGQELSTILRAKFPFLEEPALNTAKSRISYYVWHEGYGRKPEPKHPII